MCGDVCDDVFELCIAVLCSVGGEVCELCLAVLCVWWVDEVCELCIAVLCVR